MKRTSLPLLRRQFITLLGGAATTWPLSARAQQPRNLPTIGFLGAATASAWRANVSAFAKRLSELGWTDSRTIAIVYRWADGHPERFTEIAAEFVRQKVDVIVTAGTAIGAAKQATSIIPIVFAVATEPVSTGFITSLARPGGNVTGLSMQSTELAGKRLGFLGELVPGLRRLAILGHGVNPAVVLEMGEVQAAARALGLEVVTLEVQRAEDIALAFEALRDRADGLYVCTDAFIAANRVRIVILTLTARMPTIYGEQGHVESGGLISYGANLPDLFRRAADYVDKILRGAKPADLPVEQPTKFDLVINLITAKALGVEVPPSLLARADEVIE
jgi:putative ABC transport system substrate-binding protein